MHGSAHVLTATTTTHTVGVLTYDAPVYQAVVVHQSLGDTMVSWQLKDTLSSKSHSPVGMETPRSAEGFGFPCNCHALG